MLTAAVLAFGTPTAGGPVAGKDPLTVAIDMEISGNGDSSVGPIQNCAELSQVGDTFTFDLVIQGVDSAQRIAGYQVDIDYDPTVIRINSVVDSDAPGSTPPDDVTIVSRINSSAGVGFLKLTEPRPDSDGSFTVAVLDGTGTPLPPDNHEDGEGVLARITAEAVGTGVSNLIIPGPSGGPDGNPDLIIMGGAGEFLRQALPVETILSAAVSVGTACTPPPPSVPPGAGGTPQDSGTAPSGEGPAETQTPGAGTPGSSTPVLGGTPLSGPATGAGGEAPGSGETDGGGLSAVAWAGIGIGIAAAVLAASGVGWLVVKRRKVGPE